MSPSAVTAKLFIYKTVDGNPSPTNKIVVAKFSDYNATHIRSSFLSRKSTWTEVKTPGLKAWAQQYLGENEYGVIQTNGLNGLTYITITKQK